MPEGDELLRQRTLELEKENDAAATARHAAEVARATTDRKFLRKPANFNSQGTRAVISRVDAVPHGVETPPPSTDR